MALTSHFNSNGETLHHFIRALANYMNTNNFLLLSNYYHLVQGRLFMIGLVERKVHALEGRFIYKCIKSGAGEDIDHDTKVRPSTHKLSLDRRIYFEPLPL